MGHLKPITTIKWVLLINQILWWTGFSNEKRTRVFAEKPEWLYFQAVILSQSMCLCDELLQVQRTDSCTYFLLISHFLQRHLPQHHTLLTSTGSLPEKPATKERMIKDIKTNELAFASKWIQTAFRGSFSLPDDQGDPVSWESTMADRALDFRLCSSSSSINQTNFGLKTKKFDNFHIAGINLNCKPFILIWFWIGSANLIKYI